MMEETEGKFVDNLKGFSLPSFPLEKSATRHFFGAKV